MKGSSKEYFLGKVFDNSLDAIIVTDTKGYITEANKAFMKLVGYNKKEVIGKHMVEFSPMKEGTYESTSGELIHLDKKFQDYIKSTMASFVEKGKLHNAMGYQLRKDGKIVPVEDNMVFLFDNKGGRSGAFAVIREITKQKQVEDELRKSKDYAENIIESSIDSIVVVDMSGVLTRVNSAFLQLTGFSKEEVLGKHMPELVPTSAGTYKCTTGELIQIDEKFFKIVESNMLQFQEKGSMQNAINYLLRKDNKLVPVEDNMVYLLDREGKRIGAVAITRDITDRRKAEQEIRKTKEYLENIFRTSVDGVIIADDEGTISAVNKATEKIFDCSSNQLVGKPFREMEFDAKKLKVSGKELMDTMFREGTISGVERTWKKPDGTSVVVEMNIALLKDDEGNMTGSVASIRDITDRKRAEEALKESEERYQKLIETANDAIFIVDAETGSILNANKKAGELLGIPSEKIIGMHHTVMHAKEDEAYYRKLFYDNAQKEGGIILDDVFVWHRKGYRIPVEISSSAVKVGGRMVMQGIFRDITDRKRAEEALKQSEEKYYNLIERANDAIVSINRKGMIINFNKKAEELFGYSREEILGKPSYLLAVQQHRDNQKRILKQFAETGTSSFMENTIAEGKGIRKDDKEFDAEFSYYILEVHGEHIATAMIRDITERKGAEQKLLNYQKSLKALTSELILAEQKERQHFADFLHDEVGQQLFATKLQLEQLQSSLSSPESTKTLDNALNTLYQVMNQSRTLTTELSSPILKQLGLEKALEWLAEEMHKKYAIMVAFEDDKQEKPLDNNMKLLLYQSVSELLTNVAKHAQTRNASVSIKKSNSSVRICVEDNGVGFLIPNGESSDTPKVGGIGLFRIKERLEPLGGQITIKSKPNRGTQVILIAPLKITT